MPHLMAPKSGSMAPGLWKGPFSHAEHCSSLHSSGPLGGPTRRISEPGATSYHKTRGEVSGVNANGNVEITWREEEGVLNYDLVVLRMGKWFNLTCAEMCHALKHTTTRPEALSHLCTFS